MTGFQSKQKQTTIHILSTFHHFVQSARGASFQPGRAQKVFEEHKAIARL